tara:strand:+ start:8380 stop:10239 length:1860 start_codon:yes stop_codon:yes gene_type:complete
MNINFILNLFIKYLVPLLFINISCQKSNFSNNKNELTIDSIFKSYYDFKLHINPIEATKSGDYKYNDKIENYISKEYQDNLIYRYKGYLNLLNQYDSLDVTPEQWISIQVMKWDCTIKKEGLENNLITMSSPVYDLPSFELMPLIQVQSLHLYFAQLATGKSVHPFNNIRDYEDWILRVDDYLPFLDTCISKMRKGIAEGIVLPKSLTRKMIPQLDEFISNSVEQHLFYSPILSMPDSFNKIDKEYLESSYRDMITNKIKPKYIELRNFLIDEYLPECRESSGIGSLPNGLETYKYLMKLHTTTNMTIDEIHDLGKAEVKRITKEMIIIKDNIGFKGDINMFFDFIRNDTNQMPFDYPIEVLNNFNKIKKRVELSIQTLFNLNPLADFEVRRTEAFREASASAEYVPGSKDATRSGIFYVPIIDAKLYNKFTDEALFLHEAIPGHHFQLSLQQENNNLPEFLHPESIGVFVEGWALYSESLGKELGLYLDPFQYFGMLSMEIHRAIRLVVDTGIHGKGWTREEAIKYSLDHEAESEKSIIAEVERYMATPGQALSYKIGQLKIRELRTKAEKILDDKFDIKLFHDQILNSGSLPLILLEKKVNAWIIDEMKKKKISNQN